MKVNTSIDRGRARGIARHLVRNIAEERQRFPSLLKKRPFSVVTLNERRKLARHFRKTYGSAFLDAVARDEYRELHVLYLKPMVNDQGELDGLGVATQCIPLVSAVVRPALPPYRTISLINEHALERLVQRANVTEPKELSKIVLQAVGWSEVARKTGYNGSFTVPVEEGFVACGTDWLVQTKLGTTNINAPTAIRTFISHDRMKPNMNRSWHALKSRGCLVNTPRAVLDRSPTREQETCFELMAIEGRQWEQRFLRWLNRSTTDEMHVAR